MIPVPFAYYRPDTLDEAAQIYSELTNQCKDPVFYGGGTEIITMARVGSICPGAVIDIKAIAECTIMDFSADKLIIGSAVTLSQITESKLFPLLGTTAARVSDHTNQCRITLGGNVCGTIIYRETVLPMLLTDCEVVICGIDGVRKVSIHDAFDRRIKLNCGEFIVRFVFDKAALGAPFVHVKKTKNEKIDYPLLTLAAIKYQGRIRMAFSGLCDFPFRSAQIETIINDNSSLQNKADMVATQLPDKALTNIAGSGAYRIFVLKNTVLNALETLQ